jgi:Ribbon-helix-helix protein, copG family
MAIAKKPKRGLAEITQPDPMAFIQGAEHREEPSPLESEKTRPPRKEPVIIRFDDETLKQIDQAARKRGLSRAALVRMLVIENLPD